CRNKKYHTVSVHHDLAAFFLCKPLICNKSTQKWPEQHTDIRKCICHRKRSVFSRIVIIKKTSDQCLGSTFVQSASHNTKRDCHLNRCFTVRGKCKIIAAS